MDRWTRATSRRWLVVAAALAVGSLTAAVPTVAASAGSSNALAALPWGPLLRIPGASDWGTIGAISCAARGYCTAVGQWQLTYYPGGAEGFVLDERGGKWQTPTTVPGLRKGQLKASDVVTVSCRSSESCTAGGIAGAPFTGSSLGFVLDERKGAWSAAQPEPGPHSLPVNADGFSIVNSVSCAKTGDCAAVGDYESTSGVDIGFVVTETNGTWNAARAIPGLAALSGGAESSGELVSCTAVGDCSAAGSWWDGSGQHPFVVDESHGSWSSAEAVRGVTQLANAQMGPSPWSMALSCAAPGDCAIIGVEGQDPSVSDFVVDETSGSWGTASVVPGLTGSYSGPVALSCWAAGRCDAVASLPDAKTGSLQVSYYLTEHGGTWGAAHPIPGLVALAGSPPLNEALPTTISCDPTGDCAAGGTGDVGFNFVVDEVAGVWHDATAIHGGGGANTQISCLPGDHCVLATDTLKEIYTGQVASGPR